MPALNGFQSTPFVPGTRVQVANRFTAHWCGGFEVADVVDGSYRLRRRSDGIVLPATFPSEQLRAEEWVNPPG